MPHIMLVIGVLFISRKDLQHRAAGYSMCKWSTAVLILGSFVYYIFFTPLVGLE